MAAIGTGMGMTEAQRRRIDRLRTRAWERAIIHRAIEAAHTLLASMDRYRQVGGDQLYTASPSAKLAAARAVEEARSLIARSWNKVEEGGDA